MAVSVVARDVLFYYASHEVVIRNLSFDIPPRRTWAFVGPNGSGKTSLLLLVAGFHQPLAGRIACVVDGQEVSDCRPMMALSTPMLAFPPELKVAEVIALHQAMKPIRRELWETAFQQSGLPPHLDKPVTSLSSGLYQRLRLLLAFTTDVPLLLLDEPTSYLDEAGRVFYHHLMKKWHRRRTVIVASNDPAEYTSYCDGRVVL